MTILDESPALADPRAVPQAPRQGLSIASLVLGISSIALGLWFLVPVAAVVVGIVALNKEPAGRTMAIWGIITGGVVVAATSIAAYVGLALLIPMSGFWFSGAL